MTDQGKKLVYLTPAEAEVIAERRRQVYQEGFTAEHDDSHVNGAITLAAICYAHPGVVFTTKKEPPKPWPWERQWWKPKDYHTNLVKAVSLLLAELERVVRLEEKAKADE